MVKRSPQTFAFGVAASSGMASLVHLDNLECASGAGSTNEQITKLFPKCRPRDINLNPVVTHHPHHTQSSAFDDLSNDNTGVQDADADRCSSGGDGGDSDGSIGGTGSEVTETVFASEVLSLRHGSGTAGSLNVATIAGREVVVFDDIGEDWRGGVRLDLNKVRLPVLDDEPLEASPPSPACRRGAIDFFQAVASGSELDGGVGAGGRVGSSLAQHPTSGSNSNTNKGPRLIGGVPIAEYEGSPRRYGRSGHVTSTNGNDTAPVLPTAQSLLASPSVYPPRPGFPQRVLPADADDEDSCPSPTPGIVTDTNSATSAFDYLYEFSETRKVLEEFFKNPAPSETSTKEFEELDYELRRQSGPSTNINSTSNGNAYVGLRLSKVASNTSAINGGGVSEDDDEESKCPRSVLGSEMIESVERHFLDLSADTGSTDDLGENEVGQSRNFTLSPETTDCDSNCGDLDSEASLMLLDSSDGVGVVGDGSGVLAGLGSASLGGGGGSTGSGIPDTLRLYSSMPVLEDGLSSGHASDTENVSNPATVAMLMKRQITEIEKELGNGGPRSLRVSGPSSGLLRNAPSPENITLRVPTHPLEGSPNSQDNNGLLNVNSRSRHDSYDTADPELEALDPLGAPQATPPPPAPAPHRSNLELANNVVAVPTTNSTPASTSSTQQTANSNGANSTSVEAAIKDIRLALQRAKTLPLKSSSSALHDQEMEDSPIWIPRRRGGGTSSSEDPDHRKSHDEPGEEEEADTDLETDRLLGQQRTDDHGFFDDKIAWRKPKSRTVMPTTTTTNKATSLTSSASGGGGSGSAGASGDGSGGGNSASANSASPSGAGGPGGTGTTPTSTSTTPSAAASPAVAEALSPSAQTVPTTATSTAMVSSPTSPPAANGKPKKDKENNKRKGRNKEVMIHEPAVLIEGVLFRARYLGSTQLVCEGQPTKTTRMLQAEEAVSRIKAKNIEYVAIQRGLWAIQRDIPVQEAGNHQMQLTGGGGGGENTLSPAAAGDSDGNGTRASVSAAAAAAAAAAASGSVFRLRYLGSVEVDEEGGRKRRKRLKKHMVEEAVTKLKAPEGETQPSTEVDLFISTEKIMVLNTDLKEIMMDHALRTISYIADIGDLVVLMARRRFVPHDVDEPAKLSRAPKMICHVFESEEAQFIAQSIGQAFQVAYMEFLKANGIEDHSFVKEMDYQEVLNSQEIFGDELQMFAKKEMQKEVVVPKAKGEILGVVIVESGWGSMLPTVVIANLAPAGAAARCGQLNIGDQIIAINGVSLVGLPLSTCQNYIKNTKNQTVVKLTVVPCAPVVEVKIKRPDTKYQLGFSVQNGVICSLLRGGIAERGGVRVGHRIIEINNQSVVAVPHEKIVNLLATSVGEILMKTMPTSMFRLLTGQETPVFI